jgi:hypothetical protein
MSRVKVTLTASLAALALGGGMMMASAPAEAQEYGWRNRGGAGYYGRPAYRAGNYGYRTTYYRGRRSNVGGAVAAGVIGGLALGALAAAPAYSYPAYSYPAYPVASPYYGVSAYPAPTCYTVKRRFVDAWGQVFVRRTEVCE